MGSYNGDLRFDLYKGDGSIAPGYVTLTTPASNLVGGWNHVAVSWDGNNPRLYRNGSEISSTTYSFVRQDTPYLIGIGTNNASVNSINGQADEIGFYNDALTTAQIQQIYNAGRAGKCRPAPTPSNAAACGAPREMRTNRFPVTMELRAISFTRRADTGRDFNDARE